MQPAKRRATTRSRSQKRSNACSMTRRDGTGWVRSDVSERKRVLVGAHPNRCYWPRMRTRSNGLGVAATATVPSRLERARMALSHKSVAVFRETKAVRGRANPGLGIASGLCHELQGDCWRPVYVTYPNCAHVSRGVLDAVTPSGRASRLGGIDVIRANIRGWEIATIRTRRYFHHRPTGARDSSRFAGWELKDEPWCKACSV